MYVYQKINFHKISTNGFTQTTNNFKKKHIMTYIEISL